MSCTDCLRNSIQMLESLELKGIVVSFTFGKTTYDSVTQNWVYLESMAYPQFSQQAVRNPNDSKMILPMAVLRHAK